MDAIESIGVGDRVRMDRSCPIDFEGVGPLPDESGEVVALPAVDDIDGRIEVCFDRAVSHWMIPVRYLVRER